MKKYELMALPYAPDALEPVISAQTIAFHYVKHRNCSVNPVIAV
jgi:Fe-Mn family superoxide dismutase